MPLTLQSRIVNILTQQDIVDRKLFAGPRMRRLRTNLGLTQSRMAADLGLSVSYLNLLEHNQRPVTGAVLARLAETFDVDVRQFLAADTDRRAEDVAQALARAGTPSSQIDVREFTEQFPDIANGLVRLAHQAFSQNQSEESPDPFASLRAYLLDRGNHFAGLDHHAELFAEELRASGLTLDAAIRERLRLRHGLSVRAIPGDVMPGRIRRLDHHGKQLHLSENLDASARTFQMAAHLAGLDARGEIAQELASASPRLANGGEVANELLADYLAGYWAAALMMPYNRLHSAAESTGYDLDLLQARFSVGFEQLAHRLTTLQRPQLRGIPFVMVRTDRAGQISKRLAAGRLPFATDGGQCAQWILHHAFEQPGQILTQVVDVEGSEKLFTIARTVPPQAEPWGHPQPRFAIALSCALEHARGLVYASQIDFNTHPSTPAGRACAVCARQECRQRAAPPMGASLQTDPLGRGYLPYGFTLTPAGGAHT